MNKRDSDRTLTAMSQRVLEPSRGVLLASPPMGELDRRRVLPPTDLTSYLHHCWSMRWSLQAPYVAQALPHPSVTVILEQRSRGQVSARVFGVNTGRVISRLEGDGRRFGVTFRAAMFAPLLRASMASITDRVVPLAPIFKTKTNAWVREVLEQTTLEGQIERFASCLRPLLGPPAAELVGLRDLVERMLRDRDLVRVSEAAALLGVEVRALQRAFRHQVGVSPKWVIQRARALASVERLKQAEAQGLARLAAELGFADQAHFAREFKADVGTTPKAFVKGRSSQAT